METSSFHINILKSNKKCVSSLLGNILTCSHTNLLSLVIENAFGLIIKLDRPLFNGEYNLKQ